MPEALQTSETPSPRATRRVSDPVERPPDDPFAPYARKRRRFPIRGTTSRVRSSLVAMALLSFILATPGLTVVWIALAIVLALLAAHEYHVMAANTGTHTSQILLLAGAGIIVLSGALPPAEFGHVIVPCLMLLLFLTFCLHMRQHGSQDAYRAVPVTFFGMCYIGVPLALALQIASVDRLFLLFGMLAVWMADTGGYVAGKQFGRTKLAPQLSPKKTVEGLIGGIFLAVVVAILFKAAAPARAFTYGWGTTMLLPALIALLGPVGDLAESALKRDAGVKDSGVTGTGHGGVLDRIDSLLFCLVIIYTFLVLDGRL